MPTRAARNDLVWCAALPLLFFVLGCLGVHSVGLSWDEDVQRTYGQLILDYNASFGADTRALGYRNLYLYGGFFDVLAGLVERVVPSVRYDTLRHLLSLAFAGLGIFFTARLAAFFAGARAGFVSALCLVLMPRYFGHAFFNPKDIPFAALYICALYYLIEIVVALPAIRSTRAWLTFSLASGLCLGVRIGGLLLFCFLFAGVAMFAARSLLFERGAPLRSRIVKIGMAVAASLAACGLAIAVALVFWPYLRANPALRLLSALTENSQFRWNFPILFRGVVMLGPEVGRSYLPVWLWISVPPFVWIGVILSACLFRPRKPGFALTLLLLALLFPPLYAIAQGSPLYDGMRQFLFILPPLAVLSGLGWYTAIGHWRRARTAVLVFFALSLAEPASWLARSHPYEYTYFSPVAGGLAQASHAYETEYWGTSLRRAAEWFDAYRHKTGRDRLVVRWDGPWVKWELLAPFLEDASKVVQAKAHETADLSLVFARSRLPGAWMSDPKILYREQIVDAQVPFFVITQP